jgi:hypothetical protein
MKIPVLKKQTACSQVVETAKKRRDGLKPPRVNKQKCLEQKKDTAAPINDDLLSQFDQFVAHGEMEKQKEVQLFHHYMYFAYMRCGRRHVYSWHLMSILLLQRALQAVHVQKDIQRQLVPLQSAALNEQVNKNNL